MTTLFTDVPSPNVKTVDVGVVSFQKAFVSTFAEVLSKFKPKPLPDPTL